MEASTRTQSPTLQPTTPRVQPVEPPFSPHIAEMLTKWMGSADRPPLLLFRMLARNLELAGRTWPLAAGFLGKASSLDARDREIVIDRVCARCGCEYEWGVHVEIFGPKLGLSPETLRATATAAPGDPVWTARESALIAMVDELHDTSRITDATWAALELHWTEAQRLELIALAGWYHTISYLANGARVPLETWAARFPEGTRR